MTEEVMKLQAALHVREEQRHKDSMSVLINVLRVSRTPEERIWLARQIERTAIEDGYLRPEYRKHPKLVNPPRWRGGEM